mmetsp:Transcript_46586/g.74901  ORF Transcript_46586/g.74901 Transcript_46586/m.74901 type:complete len:603 (-) Transcript_46586:114-1922(-)
MRKRLTGKSRRSTTSKRDRRKKGDKEKEKKKKEEELREAQLKLEEQQREEAKKREEEEKKRREEEQRERQKWLKKKEIEAKQRVIPTLRTDLLIRYLWRLLPVDELADWRCSYCGIKNDYQMKVCEYCHSTWNAGPAGIIVQYDLIEDQKIKKFTGAIYCARFSPCGGRIAAGSSDGTVRIWSSTDGKLIRTMDDSHKDWVRSLEYSKDGKYLLSSSHDNSAKVWNESDGEVVECYVGNHWLTGSCFVGTDLIAATSRDGSFLIYNRKKSREVKTINPESGWMLCTAVSPYGTYVAAGSGWGQIHVWNVANLKLHKLLSVESDPVEVAERVAAMRDHERVVWDAKKELERKKEIERLEALRMAAKFEARMRKQKEREKRRKELEEQREKEAKMRIERMRKTTKKTRKKKKKGGSPRPTPYKHIDLEEKPIELPSEESEEEEDEPIVVNDEVIPPLRILCITFSPDGRKIASTGLNGCINIWRASDGRLLQTLEGHSEPVTCITYSKDGSHIISGSRDKAVRIWCTGDGVCRYTHNDHADWVTCVDFSPCGNRIVSGSEDNFIILKSFVCETCLGDALEDIVAGGAASGKAKIAYYTAWRKRG